MSLSPRIVAGLTVAVFAFANADDAAAGFLAPDLDGALSGNTSPAASGDRESRPEEPNAPEVPPRAHAAQLPTSATMNGATTVVPAPGGTVLAIWEPVDLPRTAGLVGNVGREPRVKRPTPFLDGVFRPPRKIG